MHSHPKKDSPAAVDTVDLAKWALLLPAPMLQHAESSALRSGAASGGEAARHLLHSWREAWTALYTAMAMCVMPPELVRGTSLVVMVFKLSTIRSSSGDLIFWKGQPALHFQAYSCLNYMYS